MEDGTFIELYTVKRYRKVHENGDPELQFDVAPTNDGGGEQEEEQSPLPAAVEEHLNGETENTVDALQDVVDIDDDNEPAPENVPQASEGDTESIFGAWGHTGFCNCHIQNIPNHPAKLNFPLDKTEKEILYSCFRDYSQTMYWRLSSPKQTRQSLETHCLTVSCCNGLACGSSCQL